MGLGQNSIQRDRDARDPDHAEKPRHTDHEQRRRHEPWVLMWGERDPGDGDRDQERAQGQRRIVADIGDLALMKNVQAQ
jgi:hypothetical protein